MKIELNELEVGQVVVSLSQSSNMYRGYIEQARKDKALSCMLPHYYYWEGFYSRLIGRIQNQREANEEVGK